MEEILTNKVNESFDNAEKSISKLNDEVLNLEGYSGNYTRHFYNNMLTLDDTRYLEIGTWKGSTVCSAMYGNKANVLCIDNWSEFGGPKQEFLNVFNKYKSENNASFVEGNCFTMDVSNLGKFNIYLYDGDHSYDSHYKALTYYINNMDDTFVFIVDDWNWQQVRDATIKSIKDLNLTTVYEKEIRTSWDNSVPPLHEIRKTWWNGMYVAVLKK
jgi:hypothetical protein